MWRLGAVALWVLSVGGFIIGGVLVVGALVAGFNADRVDSLFDWTMLGGATDIYAPLDVTIVGMLGAGILGFGWWLWTRAAEMWHCPSEEIDPTE